MDDDGFQNTDREKQVSHDVRYCRVVSRGRVVLVSGLPRDYDSLSRD
jgi:hypothetical protein